VGSSFIEGSGFRVQGSGFRVGGEAALLGGKLAFQGFLHSIEHPDALVVALAINF
jgi:hypothetical protein